MGIILCLCLNITYANVVRFPRELERHGTAFLIPYLTILFLIGLPVVLFEIAIGQFLGQGSAHSWRASPIFKGASVIGRLSSWLSTIWISLQAGVAVVYIGELIFRSVPFSQCASKVSLQAESGYVAIVESGQECLNTYSSKTLRRSIVMIGFCTLILLVFQTGWSVTHFIGKNILIEVWPFRESSLLDSALWFSALLQVIYSTSIGFGVWPVITGKFLYKGDAVRTSVVYLCFNLFVVALSVSFFLTQYNNPKTTNSTILIPDMIREAAQPSKDWGPADPIVRHAWKQWRSVCEDTGQKDFTLRRRGTRDYTHSIKKGQYSRAKYGTQQNLRQGSTPGSSSPNYSGSVFEDSAIEEDVNSDKFQGYQSQVNGFANGTKPLRNSNGSRNTLTSEKNRRNTNISTDKVPVPKEHQKQFFYIHSANDSDYNNVSKVEIVTAPASQTNYRKPVAKNPLARVDRNPNYSAQVTVPDNRYGSFKRDGNNVDHICWRKFSVNSEEYSTEL
ncbi:Sodium- and chloride-dependent glycine transporter 2 [Pseudolycoriella hygida]|uniref:Sodium- and chloride-dependent glycine transporter 2 n=1 Tax=Pseudolycoriella hygida TaxID=35572 RepID=A0A9Q0S074_9DIPT|nr:Sodium- and chloride-dependent glycine transporter 2 [Pseudolycoriella hygida]